MKSTKNEDIEKNVRNSLLLRGFPTDCQDMVIKASVCREYKRGEPLFQQGDKAKGIHVVGQGWIKLYRIAPSGDEAVVSVFTKGESFGEAVAFRGIPYPVTAEAVTNCAVMHIPISVVFEVMRKSPDTLSSVMAAIFVHLHSLVSQLQQLKVQTGAQRVAEFLLELCEKNSGSCYVTLPYDKNLIAGRLGMKPESLSRSFSRLKAVGVKIERNHATISDVRRLREFAGSDFFDESDGFECGD